MPANICITRLKQPNRSHRKSRIPHIAVAASGSGQRPRLQGRGRFLSPQLWANSFKAKRVAPLATAATIEISGGRVKKKTRGDCEGLRSRVLQGLSL